ncbi:MAG: discoidin domain-containing protein [Candidatus Theseobacter exili]|nr:discoidin domain-containing protein [Candidatus Theseobacter exili]
MKKNLFCIFLGIFLFFCFHASGQGILKRLMITDVLASSAQDSSGSENYFPRNAVDGLDWTRWSSKFNEEEVVRFKLDGIHLIERVFIIWQDAYAKEFDVEVSIDGSKWVKVYSVDSGEGGEQDINFSPTRGRFLRLNFRKRALPQWGYSFWEVEIYGDKEGM